MDAELRRRFERLKDGKGVVYPMGSQLRLLVDAFAVGEHRPFAIESLSADSNLLPLEQAGLMRRQPRVGGGKMHHHIGARRGDRAARD